MNSNTLLYKKGTLFPFLLVISAFLILFCSQILEKSMFIDGVWYANIARNLSTGDGSFWFPQFSETIFSAFHEHPPLVFGIQAFFFSLFGDIFLAERIFNSVQYLTIAFLIYRLWQHLFGQDQQMRKLWFLPIIFWQVNLVNYYYLPANVLDTTLCLFDLAALYNFFLFLKAPSRKIYFAFGILFIVGAVLSKGFVGLYPLAFFGIYSISTGKISFKKALKYTFALTSGIILAFALIFALHPPAWQSMNAYLDIQVRASLTGERRLYHYRENRFFIIGQLIQTILPMTFIGFASKYCARIIKNSFTLIHFNSSSILFFLLGLSASIPLVISPRQALLYLLPSMPLFSLSIAIWSAPYVGKLLNHHWIQTKGLSLVNSILGLACIGGIMLCINNFKKVNQRDLTVIEDARMIGKVVGEKSTISSEVYNMYISGYLMRDFQVSLDTVNTHEYLITTNKNSSPPNYRPIALPTKHYMLFKKSSEHQMTENHE